MSLLRGRLQRQFSIKNHYRLANLMLVGFGMNFGEVLPVFFKKCNFTWQKMPRQAVAFKIGKWYVEFYSIQLSFLITSSHQVLHTGEFLLPGSEFIKSQLTKKNPSVQFVLLLQKHIKIV